LVRPSLGLLGRIVAILLLTVVVEFCASTLLYERASQFSLREDEAHRLAEHLVIARKLINERPLQRAPRHGAAADHRPLRNSLGRESLPPPPPLAPALERCAAPDHFLGAERSRKRSALRLASPGRNPVVRRMTLPDGSWVYFSTREVVARLGSGGLWPDHARAGAGAGAGGDRRALLIGRPSGRCGCWRARPNAFRARRRVDRARRWAGEVRA
jgi:hypothetical protein